MRVLLDMNLSPEWVPYLAEHGISAVHWSTIGAGNAPDFVIMQWARENGCIVFTHDLDFGITLAHSKDRGPSVIQIRTQDVSPGHLGDLVVRELRALARPSKAAHRG